MSKWIPINEYKIPNNIVLCCGKHGDMIIRYVLCDKESNTGYSAESDFEYMYECIAWQPLPKPYKESEKE